MGLTVADLSAKLGLDTSVFDRGITGVLGKMNPIGGAATSTSLIAGGAIAGIGFAAVKMGEEFDAAYDTIRLGTGATGAKLDGLKDTFKQVVTDVPASFGDASAAITGLNQRLGITGPRLRELSGQFLELSRITGTDVAEDVRLGTRLFGDWSIKTSAQAGALDQLYRATQKSGIGLSDLMATVVQFGAPLRNMGFSFSDSVAMLSKWEKEGVNITTVLSGMRFALKSFAKDGIDPAKGFAKAIDDITNARSRAAAMKIGADIFGLRGAADTVAAIREGRFQYAKFAETIANGKDTIRAAAKDTEDFGESWTKMYNAMKVNVEPGLSGLFNSLSKLMDMGQVNVNPWFHEEDKSISALEKRLTHLRAEYAKKMTMGDFTGAAEIQAAMDRVGLKLDILRDHFSTPMAVGHVKNGLWISGINKAISREQYFRGIMKTPMAVGHVKNQFWLNGINQGVSRLAFFKSLLATPMSVGYLNTSGWTNGIASAAQALANFRSMAAAPMYVGHTVTGQKDSGGALGGTFSGPKSGYYTLMHGKETIVAHDDPSLGLRELAKYGMLGKGGGSGSEIHEHFHIHPPGGTAVIGSVEDVVHLTAPYMARAHEAAAARRARRR